MNMTKIKSIHIKYQMTAQIGVYENLKPEIDIELQDFDDNTVTTALDYCKKKLGEQYKKIKEAKNDKVHD